MSVLERMDEFVDRLRDSATVEAVYGDPISVGDRTVVPVASVGYGFGGGGGSGDDGSGSGSGFGGGVGATPVGVVEITEDGTRFVRFGGRRRVGVALLVGVALGALLSRSRR